MTSEILGTLIGAPSPITLSTEITAASPADEDANSLILFMLKLPVGALGAAELSVPAFPPAGALARNDSVTVNRSIGRAVIDVLGNDTSFSGSLLTITSVTQGESGTVSTVHNGSAILYAVNPGHSGSDQFTYTARSAEGNVTTATVTVATAGQADALPIVYSNEPINGTLDPNGATTTSIRGSGQKAAFFRFSGKVGHRVEVTLAPTANAFRGHLYLRDPMGVIIASGNHVPSSTGAIVSTYDNGLSVGYPLPMDGDYSIEVTSHSPTESGAFQLTLKQMPSATVPAYIVMFDDKSVTNDPDMSNPPNPITDVGLLDSAVPKLVKIVNVGSVEISSVAGIWCESCSVYPTSIGVPIRPGESQSITLTLPPGAAGLRTFVLHFDARYQGASSEQGVPFAGTVVAMNKPGMGQPELQLINPASGISVNSPTNMMLVAKVLNTAPATVRFYSVSPSGSQTIGTVVTIEGADAGCSCTWATNYWRVEKAGVYSVCAIAEINGAMASSAPVLVVARDAGVNIAPVAVDDRYRVPIDSVPVRLEPLTNDRDDNGDVLQIIEVRTEFGIVSAPGNERIAITDDRQRIRYSPPPASKGTESFQYTVADGRGGISRGVICIDVGAPSVTFTSPGDRSVHNVTDDVLIKTSVTSASGVLERLEYFANGRKIGEATDGPDFLFTWTNRSRTLGYYTLTAAAISSDGGRAYSTPRQILLNTTGTGPFGSAPVASIANITEYQRITEGFLDVIGTAKGEGENSLVDYTLRIVRPNESGAVVLASYDDVNIANGPLGRLDLTTLANGSYVLELAVTEGVTTIAVNVPFLLDSNLKIGQLAFSEQDFAISSGDLPITVVRSYNSLKRQAGDFGPSWTIAINNLDLQLDEAREATDVDGSTGGETLSMRIGGGRNVTLTLPDGRRTTFEFSLQPGPSDGGVPCFCYEAKWLAPPGVHATLTAMDNNRLQFLPWQQQIPPFWQAAGPGTPFENFDFSGFVLTNEDGTRYEIARPFRGEVELDPDGSLPQWAKVFDQPKLARIVRRNGERLEVTESGIQHLRPDGTATRSVYIKREQSRITAIYTSDALKSDGTPDPEKDPVVKYEYYDSGEKNGYLKNVHRLVTKRTQQVAADYNITTYDYTKPNVGVDYVVLTSTANGALSTTTQYDTQGRLISSSDPQGNTVHIEHDLNGRREIITDPLGHTTVHEYDSRGNVVASINSVGDTTSRTYDADNNPLTETDGLGHTSKFGYDSFGNRNRIEDPLGHTSVLEFNAFGQVKRSSDARAYAANSNDPEATTINIYHPDTGVLTTSTDANGVSTSYTYANGALDTVTDVYQNRTRHSYYTGQEPGGGGSVGDLKSVVREEYVPANPPAAAYYRMLSKTTYTYDARGNRFEENIVNQQDVVVRTTRFHYDEQNRLTETIVDPGGLNQSTTTEYDQYGRRSASIDALGRRTEYRYDRRGNVVQTVYPKSDSNPIVPQTLVNVVYDSVNRVVYRQDQHAPPGNPAPPESQCEICQPCSGCSVANGHHYVHDAIGRQTRVERLLDITVKVVPDSVDGCYVSTFEGAGLWQSTGGSWRRGDPLVSATGTEYDDAGRVVSSTDARATTTKYQYDDAGRRTGVVDGLGHETNFGHDENGNQIWVRDAKGRVTDFHYDALNRQVVTVFPQVEGQGSRYMKLTLFDDLGRRVAETNQVFDAQFNLFAMVNRFGYDGADRLISVTNAWSTPNETITRYEYDDVGNLVAQIDANLHRTEFDYDRLGRRIKRTLPGPANDPSPKFDRYFYDAAGNQILHTNFDGRILEQRFDVLNRLREKIAVTYPGGTETKQVLTRFEYRPDGKRAVITTDPDAPAGFTTQVTYDYIVNEWLTNKQVSIKRGDNNGSETFNLTYTHNARGNLVVVD